MFYELTPAYGRDYKNRKEVIAGFMAGHDFESDFQLGFKLVNKDDIPRPCTVNLRYRRNAQVAVLKVP